MAFQIVSDFPNVEYQHAYQLLQDKNWNIQQVKNELGESQRMQKQQEQNQEMALMQVLQECPAVLDIEEIRQKLISCNWNANTVIQQYKDANKVRLLLSDCSNMSV